MTSVLDAEKERRRALHRQIGALEKQLRELPKPHAHREFMRVYKLRSKLKRFQRQLDQGTLFHEEVATR